MTIRPRSTRQSNVPTRVPEEGRADKHSDGGLCSCQATVGLPVLVNQHRDHPSSSGFRVIAGFQEDGQDTRSYGRRRMGNLQGSAESTCSWVVEISLDYSIQFPIRRVIRDLRRGARTLLNSFSGSNPLETCLATKKEADPLPGIGLLGTHGYVR